ncbi:MAG: hypothetical protein H3Z52_06165 [archaeon]|nr:hypothetical protein [archaeon]MCP8320507.1 hypothetical protein [archaeon]
MSVEAWLEDCLEEAKAFEPRTFMTNGASGSSYTVRLKGIFDSLNKPLINSFVLSSHFNINENSQAISNY